jgi:hypothetical protein
VLLRHTTGKPLSDWTGHNKNCVRGSFHCEMNPQTFSQGAPKRSVERGSRVPAALHKSGRESQTASYITQKYKHGCSRVIFVRGRNLKKVTLECN